VDAAGGWVRQVAELAGAPVPLTPVRHQLLITRPAPDIDPADPPMPALRQAILWLGVGFLSLCASVMMAGAPSPLTPPGSVGEAT